MRGTAATRREQSLPVGEEAGEGVLLDRFDFAAQLGERFAADLAEDFGVAPFAMETAGTEAAFEDAAFVRPAGAAAFSTTAGSSAKRSATSRSVNGPWVRA